MKNPLPTIQHLAADEDGTAMTEFAVTLPVFLAFFGAILALGGLTQGAIKAHTDAPPQMWQNVYAAEDDDDRISPRSQAWQGSDSLSGLWSNLNNAKGGHWAESYGATTTDMFLLTGKTLPQETSYGREIHVTDDAQQVVGDSRAAMGVADDSYSPGSSFNWSSLGGGISGITGAVMSELTQLLGIQHGVGAGIRYGTVQGGHTATVEPGFGLPTTEYEVAYTSRVSPSPDSAISIPGLNSWLDDGPTRAFATSRVWVETEQPYREMFSIWGSSNRNRLNRHASNDVPLIYDDDGSGPGCDWWVPSWAC